MKPRPALLFAFLLLLRPALSLAGVGVGAGQGVKVACIRFQENVGEPFDPFIENAYLVVDPASKCALLIDPGAPDPRIDDYLARKGLALRAILNTHGHPDHTGGDDYYARRFRVKVYAHRLERPLMLTDPSEMVFFSKTGHVEIGGFQVTILPVPGHTPGSVAYLIQGLLFTGDTLFKGGIGVAWGATQAERDRSVQQELNGITHQLFTLPADTIVYPGHGEETTVGIEKASNPCLRPGTIGPAGTPASSFNEH